MRISDWSSDVCSSDLRERRRGGIAPRRAGIGGERPVAEPLVAQQRIGFVEKDAIVLDVLLIGPAYRRRDDGDQLLRMRRREGQQRRERGNDQRAAKGGRGYHATVLARARLSKRQRARSAPRKPP